MHLSERGSVRLSALVVVGLIAGLLGAGGGAVQAVTLPGTNGLVVVDAGPLVAINPVTGTRSALLGSVAADANPAINPAGNKVAFDNGGEIFVADFPAGTNRIQVTVGGGHFDPTWSVDGTTLFFECGAGICSAPATASFSAGTPILGTAAGDLDPETSPDGQWIVFSQGATTIARVPVGGGTATVLNCTGCPGGLRTLPHVSPDNQFVYFFIAGNGIARVPFPNGGVASPVPFGGFAAGDTDPFVAPDNSQVCATAAAGGIVCTPTSGIGTPGALVGSLAGDVTGHWQRTGVTPTPTPPGATPTPTPGCAATNGDDRIVVTTPGVTCNGGPGNDTLGVARGVANVTLNGGDGDDVLCGRNRAATTLIGGPGFDLARFDRRLDTVAADIEGRARSRACRGMNPR